MAAPNYPRNGNQQSVESPSNKQNGGGDLHFGPVPIRWIVFNKIDKMGRKLVLKPVWSLSRQYVDDVRVSWF